MTTFETSFEALPPHIFGSPNPGRHHWLDLLAILGILFDIAGIRRDRVVGFAAGHDFSTSGRGNILRPETTPKCALYYLTAKWSLDVTAIPSMVP